MPLSFSQSGAIIMVNNVCEFTGLMVSFINLHYRSRKSALASLKSGNKKVALRHAREIKLSNESREKCSLLLNRVEEVLRVIADAESTKKVSSCTSVFP